VRLSEHDYLSDEEWLMLRVNFTNKRAYYKTMTALPNGTFAVNVPMLTDRVVSHGDAIGTGSLGGLDPSQTDNNKTWTFVMNSVNTSITGRLQHTVMLAAAQCDVDGCVKPKVSLLPDVYSPWSHASTWPSGVVPGAGDDVIIANNMAVEMDVSPPLLGNLRIEGALRFKNDSAKTLRATTITVFGLFEIGTAATPFPFHASVELHGDAGSPSLVLDDSYFLGNKVMAVFGSVSFVAPVPATTWTKLSATVAVGATSLTVVDSVLDWSVGATIVITPTEYDSRQREEVVISSVTAGLSGSTVITFSPPLQHKHIATAVTGGVLAAGVGLVSRSITVSGADAGDGYGAHVVVGQLTIDQDVFAGSVLFRGVHFHDVGQLNSEYPAVHFVLPRCAVLPLTCTQCRTAFFTTNPMVAHIHLAL
jgi:hypothetical protein